MLLHLVTFPWAATRTSRERKCRMRQGNRIMNLMPRRHMSRDKLVLISLCLFVFICGYSSVSAANYPSWWTNRGVIADVAVTNDFAAVNAGQLKWFALKAKEELDEKLAGGAGPAVNALIASFTSSNNYLAVNAGQLKSVAAPFWARLAEVTNSCPWPVTGTNVNDFALVNIGQVKNMFSFDLLGGLFSGDSDFDGMPDSWEQQIVNASFVDNIEKVDHVLAGDDFDGDGVSNMDEYRFGASPVDKNSVPPLVGFMQTEMNSGTNLIVNVPLKLYPATSASVQIRVYIAGGVAVNGIDYSYTNQLVVFASGQTNKQVSITILNNNNYTTGKTISLGIDQLVGPAIINVTACRQVLTIGSNVIDTDGDGLPNWWELKYYGNITNAVATANSGVTGWNNLDCYNRQADPTKPVQSDSLNILKLKVETVLR